MLRRSPIIQDESNTDPELEPLAPSDPTCPEKPAPFDFLTENVYYTEALTSRERKKAKRMVCECQFDPEQDDPEDACGENCLNRLLMIECGSRCPCCEYCTNKRFQRGAYSQVEVFRTQKKGWGLRSLTNIPQGAFVMEYCGEVISPVQFEERKKQYTIEKRRHYYFMSLRTDEILDATRKGNLSRFINHSCDPNCETQKWTVQGKLRIGFFTVRKIAEGQEVTFDYQFQRFGDVAQRCYCGSSNCRGYLGQSKQTTPLRTANARSLRDAGSPREGGWRRRNAPRAENQEDSLFEKQIYDIVGSSWRLRNMDQVISISRIMLQAESLGQRVMLLHVLQATEDQTCLRKFLSLHGLRLLWSWMVDSPEPDSVNVLQFREQLLQVLGHLPITTRNQLTDGHLVTMVTRWLKPTTKPLGQVASITCPPQPSELLQQPLQQAWESIMEATVVTEADSNMDSEASKMEDDEGSCDSVGVVRSQSESDKKLDNLTQDSCSIVEEMEVDLDLKQEEGRVKNVLMMNEAESVITPLDEVQRSPEVDTESGKNVMAASKNESCDQEAMSCDMNIHDQMQHDEVMPMSCDSVAQSCAAVSDADSAATEMSSRQIVQSGSAAENQSHDKQLESHDIEVASHDKVESHGKESASLFEEVIESHDKELESHDKEVASHDKELESHDRDLTLHDKELEPHDKEFALHDKELESHENELEVSEKQMESHGKELESHENELEVRQMESHGKEQESHDQKLESHENELEVRQMESHGKELESHDQKLESHENELEVREKQMESHGKELESHDQKLESHENELEVRDKELESQDKEMESHDKELESQDKEMESRDKEMESHNKELESRDKEMESHDKRLESRDKELESCDKEMESLDKKMESHDDELESHELPSHDNKHNSELESHNKELESHDKELVSHEKELVSHDASHELSHDEVMISQKAELGPLGTLILSHESGPESHDTMMTSQNVEMRSPETRVMSPDSESQSNDNQVIHSNPIMTGNNNSEHELKNETRNSEAQPHDSETVVPDRAGEAGDSLHLMSSPAQSDNKHELCGNDSLSCVINSGSLEINDAITCSEVHVTSTEVDPCSVLLEEESRDTAVRSHDSETKSCDRKVKSYDNDVKSDSSDSQSGDENEVVSCEAEAKQVGGVANEELAAASARVVTMATELLEKWDGLKEVFRIPKRAQPAKKTQLGSPHMTVSDSGREVEGKEGDDGGRVRTPKGSGGRRNGGSGERGSGERGSGERGSRERGSGERGSERKRRWDHWNRSPPPPDPPVARQSQDTPPSWSGKRKVLLPKPKNIFQPSSPPIIPSQQHTSTQSTPVTTTTVGNSTALSQPPYVVTQNTGTSFTSSTRFPTPPVPVQNTVIVQQGGQSVYVQQQVYQDGCQTTIMPTHYMPPAQPFMIPPPSLQPPQSTALHPPPLQSTITSHTLTQAPPTITQVPPTFTQPLPAHPHLPMLPTLPSLPPQIPPTGFIRPGFSQPLPQMLVAPPPSQNTLTPSPLSLPPPPPTEMGLPYNWRTAKDPQGKIYYYHVITRKSQWTRPTDRDADGSVTMDLASSDEVKEDSSQTESLRAPHTPDGTPPPLAIAAERNSDTESTDATPSPSPSYHSHPPIHTSPLLPHSHSPHHTHSPQRSLPPSPHTPPLLPPPSTPPPSTANNHTHPLSPPPISTSPSPHVLPLPGPSTPPFSPSHSPASPLSPSPTTHSQLEPHPPPEKRAKVAKNKHHRQRESFKHKVSRVVTQCLDQHRKVDCKYGRITCSDDFKYLARKLTHGLAEKELQRRHGSAENLVFNDSVKSKVKEYIRQYMKKYGPIYNRT